MLKFTESGCKKIYDVESRRAGLVGDYYEDLRFTQDDFSGAVILSIEEARMIRALVDDLYFATDREEVENLAYEHERILRQRITQAEINKLLSES